MSLLESVVLVAVPPPLTPRSTPAAPRPGAEPASPRLVLLVGIGLLLVLVVLFALSLGTVLLVGAATGAR